MQLLTIESMLAHHRINKALCRRVIGKVAAAHHHLMLWLKQKAARWRGRHGLGSFSERGFTATGTEHNKRGQ